MLALLGGKAVEESQILGEVCVLCMCGVVWCVWCAYVWCVCVWCVCGVVCVCVVGVVCVWRVCVLCMCVWLCTCVVCVCVCSVSHVALGSDHVEIYLRCFH
jgi:hypothetical protein